MNFKKLQLVKRKDSHKNSWWKKHEDCHYVVMHDVLLNYDTMMIYPVGIGGPEKWICVYVDSMEPISEE